MEMVELELLSHSEYAAAGKLLGRRTPELIPRAHLSSKEDLAKWMAGLGFPVDRADPWLRLGLNFASCKHIPGVANNRLALGLRFIEAGEVVKNNKISKEDWAYLKARLQEASKRC